MYLKDGIVYGEQQVLSLKVSDVKVLPDRILLITFNNGETRFFDMEELRGPAFESLKDPGQSGDGSLIEHQSENRPLIDLIDSD